MAPPGENRGPQGRSKTEAFYNPAMQVNRDLSLAVVKSFADHRGRPIDFADVLAGTGARSLRLAREVDADFTVHANDADPKAVEAITAGVATNKIDPARVEITHGDAHQFLAKRRYDIVDIDPFGSPMPFLDSGMRATRHGGLLCVTATDTAALCGTYPRVCRRRYGAEHGLHKAPWRAEVGLRILAGAVMRSAGRFDRAATPVLSIARGHWMRVIVKISDGRQKTDDGMKQMAYATMSEGGLGGFERHGDTGPLWAGPLHDAKLVASLAATPEMLPDTHKLLELVRGEAEAPAFWADPGILRRVMRVDAPRRRDLVSRLEAAGHQAGPTHMDPQGVRTDANLEQLRKVWAATSN